MALMPFVDFVASRPHYVDHLAPVWRALPDEARGSFFVPNDHDATKARVAALGLTHPETPRGKPGLVLTAGYRDAEMAVQMDRRTVLMEHGAGQSYADAWHWASGAARDIPGVVAHFVPGPCTRWNSSLPLHVVGSPRIDQLRAVERAPLAERALREGGPVVAVSFHWECTVVPETYSSWAYFLAGVLKLKKAGYKVLGHGHPMLLHRIRHVYQYHRIEVADTFEEVVQRADVYCVDNSSTLFEFAALDLPVVVLNAPWFRRHVDHGLRFWEYADVGTNCNRPDALPSAVKTALLDYPSVAARRQHIVRQVYLPEGGAALAAKTLLDLS
jgi:hypothetical protein